MEQFDITKYYNSLTPVENVTLDMLHEQWKLISFNKQDSTYSIQEEDYYDNINNYSTQYKTELKKCMEFLLEVVHVHHREYLNWFISLDIPVTRYLIIHMVFWETAIDTTNSNLLGCLVDLNWVEEVDFILTSGLICYTELISIIYTNFEHGNNLLFERMIHTNFFHNTYPILKKTCYHMFCLLGMFEYWKILFPYRTNDWWTIEECIAEMDNPISDNENYIVTSRYYTCEADKYTEWDLYDHISQCATEQLVTIILRNRFEFKIKCNGYNELLNISIQTSLEMLPYDIVTIINEYFWGKHYKIPNLQQGYMRLSRNTFPTKLESNMFYDKIAIHDESNEENDDQQDDDQEDDDQEDDDQENDDHDEQDNENEEENQIFIHSSKNNLNNSTLVSCSPTDIYCIGEDFNPYKKRRFLNK